MLDFYVKTEAKQRRLRDGPFRKILEPLAVWLHKQGYCKTTGEQWFRDIRRFNRWFIARGYRGKSVNKNHVRRYFDEYAKRPVNRYYRGGERRMFPRLLAMLDERRKPTAKEAKPIPPKPFEDYQRYLIDWYKASASGVQRHRKYIEAFQAFVFGKAQPDWNAAKPAHVLDFLRQQAESNLAVPYDIIGPLRCYFRYLQLRGYEVRKLFNTLPRLYRRRESLPERLWSPQQVKQWLSGFPRSGPEALRDYAMALCLTDLGLRVGDLVVLKLEDLDWHKGTIRVPNSKTGRTFHLPLPARTAKAIARYLRHERPRCELRTVFIRHQPPLDEPLTQVATQRRMRRIARKQGIPWHGTHVLRHTAATRMRRGGASLKEIADVLGHVNLSSAAIYAKVDIQELVKVVQPWPEVQP
jgi:site-specific recombinase XerD